MQWPSDDINFKFTLESASEVYIRGDYSQNNLHLVLLNSTGAFVDEQYYSWVGSATMQEHMCSYFSAGLYLFKILQGGYTYSRKVLIEK